jgi:hypothetical protein
MKQLIIDRSRWRTGGANYNETHGSTYLLNSKGYMCCLGFYCLQLGELTENEIRGIGFPEDIRSDNLNDNMFHLIRKDNIIYGDTWFTTTAANINDDSTLDNAEREENIIEHFKQIDVDVIFTGEYNHKL